MGKCEVCGREKIVRGQGFQEDRCWRGFLEQDDMKCYRLGYERSQAALAAANEELAKYRARPYATLAADLRAAEADLRAANARADAAEAERDELRGEAGMYKQRYFEKGAESQQWAAKAGASEAALAAARRECERLRKALEPFARMADRKDGWPADSGCAHLPSMAQVRAARAALSAPAAGEEA